MYIITVNPNHWDFQSQVELIKEIPGSEAERFTKSGVERIHIHQPFLPDTDDRGWNGGDPQLHATNIQFFSQS